MTIFTQAFEDSIKSFIRTELAKREGGLTERNSHPWNRVNSKWTPQEEKYMIERVSIFLDRLALSHRRSRGVVVSRLNKLLKEGRLCGLTSRGRLEVSRAREITK